MVVPTNDTGLHKDVRANFIDLQTGDPVHTNWHGTRYPGHVLEVRDDDVIVCLPQLGDTHPNGGTTAHQKNRFQVLDRIRSLARLTSPQVEIWGLFKEEWDNRMRRKFNTAWEGFCTRDEADLK